MYAKLKITCIAIFAFIYIGFPNIAIGHSDPEDCIGSGEACGVPELCKYYCCSQDSNQTSFGPICK